MQLVSDSLHWNETALFDRLKRFQLQPKCPTSKPLRVAGGWVRDKYLGRTSEDIDIVLEDCTGEEFANAIATFLSKESKLSLKVCLVKANPDKSKHLATAKIHFEDLNLDVDFVNLRTELYATTRIPSVAFGTPVDDAFRRDFTINSLFYNLSISAVEDWTGLGIQDLQDQLLRTPLEPSQTFLDDPLRVLRAARFLGKFPSFRPHSSLETAASDPKLQPALRQKVSRDRFRQEIQKCIAQENVVRSWICFTRWSLWNTITISPESLINPSQRASILSYSRLSYRLSATKDQNYLGTPEGNLFCLVLLAGFSLLVKTIQNHTGCEYISKQCESFWNPTQFKQLNRKGIVYLGVMFLFHREQTIRCPDLFGADSDSLMEYCVSQLGTRSFARDLARFFPIFDCFVSMMQETGKRSESSKRNEASLVLTLPGADVFWELALALAALFNEMDTTWERHVLVDPMRCTLDCAAESCNAYWSNKIPAALLKISAYQKLLRCELGLEGIWELKPIFSGRDISRLFPKLPKGPIFGSLCRSQRDWMIANWHPSCCNDWSFQERLLTDLKSRFRAYC